jgi:hypothetical protein
MVFMVAFLLFTCLFLLIFLGLLLPLVSSLGGTLVHGNELFLAYPNFSDWLFVRKKAVERKLKSKPHRCVTCLRLNVLIIQRLG